MGIGLTRKSLVRMLAVVVTVGVLLGAVFVPSLASAEGIRASGVTIVAIGWDEATAYASAEAQRLLPFARAVSFESFDSFETWMAEGYGTLLIISHGLREGLAVSGKLVPWDALGTALEGSPAHTVLLAACYSQAANSGLSGRLFHGWSRLVDVDEAVYTSAALVYAFRGNVEKARELTGELTEIMWAKFFGISDRPLLTLHTTSYPYATKHIRGIPHVKHSDSYTYPVEYTHPDTYVHYPWIGTNWGGTLTGSNLIVGQLKKSDLDALNLVGALSTFGGIVGAVVAFILITLASVIVAAVLLAVGLTLTLLIDLLVRDEGGAGWAWVQNVWSAWYGSGLDLKIGGVWWFNVDAYIWGPSIYPLLYGWEPYLGIDGW